MPRTLLTTTLAIVAVTALALIWRSPQSPAVPHEVVVAGTLAPEEIKDLFLARGCVNCHDVHNLLVGPSFAAIAERYRGEPQAETVLLASLRQGSQGLWGAEAMPVHRVGQISDEEAEAMVRWILEQGIVSEAERNGP
jgi:cytochrome c